MPDVLQKMFAFNKQTLFAKLKNVKYTKTINQIVEKLLLAIVVHAFWQTHRLETIV
jgi:hypothetical protein